MQSKNYLKVNREAWNKRTEIHIDSAFYDNDTFIAGRTSLNSIELNLLGDLNGKTALHLQCHFGQDTISLSRLGAMATGVYFSDKSIDLAKGLSNQTNANCRFICCDIYDLEHHLDETFDVVFTSYGTIGWLPDIERWAKVIHRFLKPGGKFVFAEFHPAVWMFDDDFKHIKYRYFNSDSINEVEQGTYTNKDADIEAEYITWNHGLGEVITSLLNQDMELKSFEEFDYSPYDCFSHTVKIDDNKFRIKHLDDKIPMVYALTAIKK